jgi:hypothetical protein
VTEEQGLGLRQVVLGQSCWKKGPASDAERGSKDRAPLHPIYEVRQLCNAHGIKKEMFSINVISWVQVRKSLLGSGL